jgi:hypothetical protein
MSYFLKSICRKLGAFFHQMEYFTGAKHYSIPAEAFFSLNRITNLELWDLSFGTMGAFRKLTFKKYDIN